MFYWASYLSPTYLETNNMKTPQDYPRRILLTIAGSSPAIVTETLYALTQQKQTDYFLPTEIHIITTAGVIDNINKTLLGITEGETKKEGAIEALCHDYHLDLPHIDSNTIHIISDKNGNQLSDIITEADNEATANFIISKVRELTADDDSSLHVSIAGGRKTMTFYLGYAMSVFGRIQDQMSHVLVENDIRSHDFFYPTPKPKTLKTFDNKEIDASKVKIMLGYSPYIRLRDGLTDELLQDKSKNYSEIIEVAQRQLIPLSIEYKNNKLYCGGYPIELSLATLSLYIWILWNHKINNEYIELNSDEGKQKHTTEFMTIYEKLDGNSGHYDILAEKISKGTLIDNDYIRPHLSNIKKAIEKNLGRPAAAPYLIQSSGKRGEMIYSLSNKIKPHHIKLPEFKHYKHV